jgi:hypothetical protein
MAKKNSEKGVLEQTAEEINESQFEDQQELNDTLQTEPDLGMEGEGEPSDVTSGATDDLPSVAEDYNRQLANRPEELARFAEAVGVDVSNVEDPNSPDDVVIHKAIAQRNPEFGESKMVDTIQGGNVSSEVQAFRTAGPAAPAEGQKYTSSAAEFAPQSAWYAPQPPTEYGYSNPENDNIDPIETDGLNDLKDRNRREGGVIDPALNGDLRRLKLRI